MTALRGSDLARLLALAVIWSASFVFIRVLVPALGPVWTATGRMLVGGAALVAWLALTSRDGELRKHWRAYLVVGLVSSAAPFLLFAWAALTLPASYLVILNAATPLFAALVSAVALSEGLGATKLAGLVAGAAGVALISRAGPLDPTPAVMAAIAASLGATLCYALAGVGLKRWGAALKPTSVAAWSQLGAGVLVLPIAFSTSAPGPITPAVAANLAALALVCSAVAYVLYYRLIADIGPTRAATVTFLMPAFGIVWGAWWLGEEVTLPMIAGALLIVAGTAAVLKRPRASTARAGPPDGRGRSARDAL